MFAAVALGLLITLGVLARRRLGVSDEPDGERRSEPVPLADRG